MTQPRIDWRKLARLFLLALVLPVSLAFALDRVVGSTPILTIAAVMIFIPLATLLVNRTALHEMDRIIEVVAPPERDDHAEQTEGATAPDLAVAQEVESAAGNTGA